MAFISVNAGIETNASAQQRSRIVPPYAIHPSPSPIRRAFRYAHYSFQDIKRCSLITLYFKTLVKQIWKGEVTLYYIKGKNRYIYTPKNPSIPQREKQEPESNHTRQCSCANKASGIAQEASKWNIVIATGKSFNIPSLLERFVKHFLYKNK